MVGFFYKLIKIMSAYIGTRASANWTGQIGSGGVADDTVTTVPLQSSTGLVNGKVYIVTIDRVDGNGTETPSSKEIVKGTLSGTNLINCTRGVEGTAQQHNAGAVVEVLFTATHHNEIIEGLEAEHDADGTHSTITATSVKIGTGSTVTDILDEDDMASDSATALSTQQSIKAYVDGATSGKNLIINGGFTINQRSYTSASTLASGAYGHDRWKAGASGGDYTFTQLASPTQITIGSGKTLIQVIEDKNVVGGTYTLSWSGTAQARAGVDSATPSGSYASSPLTISSQTAGTVMSVEFNEGTLGEVQLSEGTSASSFIQKSYSQELIDCQRYYEVGAVGHRGSEVGLILPVRNSSAGNKQITFDIFYKVTKRTIPTVSFVSGTTFAFEQSTNTDRWSTPHELTGSPHRTDHSHFYIQDSTNFALGDLISTGYSWIADAEL